MASIWKVEASLLMLAVIPLDITFMSTPAESSEISAHFVLCLSKVVKREGSS